MVPFLFGVFAFVSFEWSTPRYIDAFSPQIFCGLRDMPMRMIESSKGLLPRCSIVYTVYAMKKLRLPTMLALSVTHLSILILTLIP